MKKRYLHTAKSSSQGFSIIELIVSIGIFSLVVVILGSFQKDVFFLSTVARNSLISAQDARAVVRVIAKELRGMSQSNNGSYPLELAATSSIKFYSDVDADGTKELIRYYLSGRKLMRGVVVPTGAPLTYATTSEVSTVLVNDVRNATSTPIFTYYDSSYTGTTSAMTSPINITGVRLVKTTIQVDADPNRAPVLKTYVSQAALRNLKDNL